MSDPTLKDREAQVDDIEPQDQAADGPSVEAHEGGNIEVQPSRSELRKKDWENRVGSVIEARNKPLTESIEHLRRTQEGINQALSRLTQQQPERREERQGAPTVDPQFKQIRKRQAEIYQLIGQAKTQADVDRLEDEFTALDQQALDLRAGAQAEDRIAKFRKENPPPKDHETEWIQSNFGDVIGHQRAANWAVGAFQQAVAELDHTPTMQDRLKIHERVLQAAGERYGLRRPPVAAPKPHEQARFGGASPSGGGPRGSGTSYRLSDGQIEIAMATYPHLSKTEAMTKWAETALRNDPRFFDQG